MTHTGVPSQATAACWAFPPAAARYWNASPSPGVKTRSANAAPGVPSPRSMTPALAAPSVLVSDLTWATTDPSPASGCDARLNWSDPFQMSAPPPATVQVVPSNVADPASPGDPTSAFAQAGWGVTATPVNVAVARVALLCAVTASPARATGGRATGTGDPNWVQVTPSGP